MQVLLYKMLIIIAIAVLKLCDRIFEIFNFLAGIKPVEVNGASTNLIEFFTSNEGLIRVFGWICCVGVVVGAVFAMVSLIKSMTKAGQKAQTKIFGQYFVSIFGMVIAFTVIIMAVWATSQVLEMIHISFNGGESKGTIGSQIIGKLIDMDSYNIHAVDAKGNKITISAMADDIVGKFQPIPVIGLEDIALPDPKFSKIIDIRAFPYFIAILAAGVLLWSSFSAILGLIVRLYDIAFLTLVMPLPLAVFPLDDGARFKLWRETMISKLLLAYGTVFAVNIYALFIGQVMKIQITNRPELSKIFQILLIVCGAFTISAGSLLFARIMGTDAQESRQANHNFRNLLGGAGTAWGLAKGAKKALLGGKPGGGGGGGSSPSTSNPFGSIGGKLGERGGLLGAGAVAAGAFNRLMGGNAYKAKALARADKMKAKINASKAQFMQKGGLLGAGGRMVDNIRVSRAGNEFQQSMKRFELSQKRASRENAHTEFIKQREENIKAQRAEDKKWM